MVHDGRRGCVCLQCCGKDRTRGTVDIIYVTWYFIAAEYGAERESEIFDKKASGVGNGTREKI